MFLQIQSSRISPTLYFDKTSFLSCEFASTSTALLDVQRLPLTSSHLIILAVNSLFIKCPMSLTGRIAS